MTCKDCIHDGVCYLQEVTNDIDEQLREFGCEDFKNKADFFEIVRCENCKHGDKFIVSKDINGVEKEAVYCLAKNAFTSCNSWCDLGERKDT
jgi:hypothetical protein